MATTRGCAPASVTSVTAEQSGDTLTLTAKGETPTPGFEVSIEQSLLTVEPPAFTVLACPLPGMWPQHVAEFTVAARFHVGAKRDHVVVYTSEGPRDVPVEQGSDEGAALTSGGDETAGGDTATGYSSNLSYDEAFAAAVAALPGPPADFTHVRVEEVGGLFGGVVGQHDLYVKVRRVT